jgi:hypothetical protein
MIFFRQKRGGHNAGSGIGNLMNDYSPVLRAFKPPYQREKKKKIIIFHL